MTIKVLKFVAALALMAAFFFAGVRFCVLAQRIEVVSHNGNDYICTVEVFGREDFYFAEWNPLPVKENNYGIDTEYTAYGEV